MYACVWLDKGYRINALIAFYEDFSECEEKSLKISIVMPTEIHTHSLIHICDKFYNFIVCKSQ